MKRSFIGAMAAGMMVAGAAVAMNPGVASAQPEFFAYQGSIVDPDGGTHPLDSQFGNKFRVELVVGDFEGARISCKLTLFANGNERALSTSTISLKRTDIGTFGSKTTSALKPGSYYAVTRCSSGGADTVRDNSFTIVNAPPLTISGTATCYQGNQEGGKNGFVRPVGLDLVADGRTYPVRLSGATSGENRSTTSKFTFKSYSSDAYTAQLKCGGTARNPGRVFTFP
ncbi:hypothetical protein, partial [Williamsia sp.]|uniref:hypothetical protein n=1 Tax=Williamsia sp. TaxID=1872085 RepID=UPI001A1EA47D